MFIQNQKINQTVTKYRSLYIKAKTDEERNKVRLAYFSENYRVDILENYWDYICFGVYKTRQLRNYNDMKQMSQMKQIGYTVSQIAENFEVSVWTVRLCLKKYERRVELC